MKAYIDFDSCYYNLARIIYNVAPWTVVTNKFNHIISAPHWMEGHFGVKKIAYLAPPIRVKLKTRRFIRVFNVDAVPNGRSTMTEFLASVLEDVKVFAPGASIVHKDSIMAEVDYSSMDKVKGAVMMPCTIGVGCSAEEARDDCKARKIIKKGGSTNVIVCMLYVVPMITSYLLNALRREVNEDYKNFRHVCSAGLQFLFYH